MKIFVLFLPQFHEIPENNMWWGEEFTEWVNVKKGRPLFEGHDQPKKPLNDRYYNLLDKEVVQWQTDLMQQYCIDGFIYYHYYFNGKKLLEKPAEQLLKWKDINQPFFFNWANHSWIRSWKGTKELLQQQEYGKEEDWRRHFEYLLPFFYDHRYVKIDNMPIFMIYDGSFFEKKDMMNCFDRWCKEAGFNGIYVIEETTQSNKAKLSQIENNKSEVTKQLYITEPTASKILLESRENKLVRLTKIGINKLNQKGVIRNVVKIDGNKLLELSMKNHLNEKYIRGVFFEWDNTPRHGNRGYIITPISKEVFLRYMNSIKDIDFCVVNAWNEWCEGMMLEPTQKEGYKYLEWIREWKDKQN